MTDEELREIEEALREYDDRSTWRGIRYEFTTELVADVQVLVNEVRRLRGPNVSKLTITMLVDEIPLCAVIDCPNRAAFDAHMGDLVCEEHAIAWFGSTDGLTRIALKETK